MDNSQREQFTPRSNSTTPSNSFESNQSNRPRWRHRLLNSTADQAEADDLSSTQLGRSDALLEENHRTDVPLSPTRRSSICTVTSHEGSVLLTQPPYNSAIPYLSGRTMQSDQSGSSSARETRPYRNRGALSGRSRPHAPRIPHTPTNADEEAEEAADAAREGDNVMDEETPRVRRDSALDVDDDDDDGHASRQTQSCVNPTEDEGGKTTSVFIDNGSLVTAVGTALQTVGGSTRQPSDSPLTHNTEAESGLEPTAALERMKYDAPEDPRNYIINMIVNSSTRSVTLEFIHAALQWEEYLEAEYGTVMDYLQGYQSIFAVSPIDDRVTLRRPLLTSKSARVGRRQRREEHLISSRIGSISYSYVAVSFDLDALTAIYKRRGYEAEMIYDVLHVSSQRMFDLFLFGNGVVVWWGLNRRDHWLVEDDFLSSELSFVSEAVKERYEQKDIDEIFPIWCSYEIDKRPGSPETLSRFATYLCFDHYLVPEEEPIRTQIMLTVSYTLGRSAIVDFFEYVTQWSHKQVLSIPSDIQGLLDYFSTRRQIAHLEGELHLALIAITALRDTPDFLWEMSWLCDYYEVLDKQNSSEQRLSWFSARSDALLQQLANIKTRRFRLFMLGSDVFLILLLVADVCFIMSRFVSRLYFRLEDTNE